MSVPEPDQPAGAEPRYTVAAVARRLGVAPATLRTWDRRYGLGPTEHQAGAHRRYSRADLDRLQTMRRLTLDGVPPAAAARVALSASRGGSTTAAGASSADWLPPGGSLAPPGATGGHIADRAPTGPAFDAGRQADAAWTAGAVAAGGRGGGRSLRLPGAGPEVRGLARAALALDAAGATALIHTAIRARGAPAAWHQIIAPVLIAIGERFAATGQGVDAEHLLSECVLAALRASRGQPAVARPAADDARVLLGCAPDEFHALPTHVMAVALADAGVPSRLLGAAVPPRALAAAVRRVRPAVVFLWSSMAETGDPAVLAALPTLSPAVRVIVGGPGWALDRLPPTADIARDVPHAVGLIRSRLGL